MSDVPSRTWGFEQACLLSKNQGWQLSFEEVLRLGNVLSHWLTTGEVPDRADFSGISRAHVDAILRSATDIETISFWPGEPSMMSVGWRPWRCFISEETYWATGKIIPAKRSLPESFESHAVALVRSWASGYELGRKDGLQFSWDRAFRRPEVDGKRHQPSPQSSARVRQHEEPPEPVSGVSTPDQTHLPEAPPAHESGHESSPSFESSVGGVAAPTVGEGGWVGNDPAADENDRSGEDHP